MPPVPQITQSAINADWSGRVVDTTTVAASPATAAETTIATLNIPNFGAIPVTQKVYLAGWVSMNVGTSGTAVRLRIKQTSASGSTVVDTGAVTGGVTAAAVIIQDVCGSDAAPGVGTYVLTATVGGASAASTVNSVQLTAVVV